MTEVKGELTVLLRQWASGDEDAREELVPHVYNELRVLARRQLSRERGDVALQPTMLVHEAFLRLSRQAPPAVSDSAQYFALASHVMRHVLVDHARARDARKRGGDCQVTLTPDIADAPGMDKVNLLDLNRALERLERMHPDKAKLVELRFFAGLTVEECATVLGVSVPTVHRHWAFAKAWLFRALQQE